jgi:hypothetical protein
VRIGLIVFVGSWVGIRDRGRRVIRSGIEGVAWMELMVLLVECID